jgi:hypothetical protein
MVSMSLLDGLRVSSRAPSMDRTTRPMPRFDKSASMDSSSAVLRASLSGLVTVSTSPSRMKARHSASFTRLAVLKPVPRDALGAGRRQVAFLRRHRCRTATTCWRCSTHIVTRGSAKCC